jgi:hypothetical protein
MRNNLTPYFPASSGTRGWTDSCTPDPGVNALQGMAGLPLPSHFMRLGWQGALPYEPR